jgi:hypothetical protein
MCIIRILYGKKCFALQVEFQTIADAGKLDSLCLSERAVDFQGRCGYKLKQKDYGEIGKQSRTERESRAGCQNP